VRSDDKRFDSLKQFIEYARQNPEALTPGMNIYSDDHLALSRFNKMFDTKTKRVFIGHSKKSRKSLLGNYADFMIDNTLIFRGFVGSGKPLKVLTVLWSKRIESLDPSAPTIKEITGKEIVSAQYRGFMTKKGIPTDRLGKLRESFKEAIDDPEFIQKAKKQGIPLDYYDAQEQKRLTYEYQDLCSEFFEKKS
jgi:tripartite-type tricarboxylate transporter receptor subunit TctC